MCYGWSLWSYPCFKSSSIWIYTIRGVTVQLVVTSGVLNWCVKGAEAWTTHGYVTVSGQSACLFSRKKCEAIQPNCEVLLLCLSLTSTELTDADVVMEIASFDLCWRECLSGNPSCLTFGLHLGSTSGLWTHGKHDNIQGDVVTCFAIQPFTTLCWWFEQFYPHWI